MWVKRREIQSQNSKISAQQQTERKENKTGRRREKKRLFVACGIKLNAFYQSFC